MEIEKAFSVSITFWSEDLSLSEICAILRREPTVNSYSKGDIQHRKVRNSSVLSFFSEQKDESSLLDSFHDARKKLGSFALISNPSIKCQLDLDKGKTTKLLSGIVKAIQE